MSHIINKIFGRDDESDKHSHSRKSHVEIETNTSSSAGDAKCCQGQNNSDNHVNECRTVQNEGVNIKSTISSDTTSTVSMANQQKLNDLVTKLGSTHSQIDTYAKKQASKINKEIQREIDEVVVRTRRGQDELLRVANEHTARIDSEYRARLQQMVEEVDANKAKQISEIEQELNNRQADMLELARDEIDRLNQKAANLKIDVLQAQAQAESHANEITAQAAHLGQASTVHQSTGTTTIKTEVTAAATTKDSDKNATVATTQETTGSASKNSQSATVATTHETAGSARKTSQTQSAII